jgi:hypothetical protein
MGDIDLVAGKLEALDSAHMPIQWPTPIDIPGDGGQRCQITQALKNGLAADISGVDDMLDSGKEA